MEEVLKIREPFWSAGRSYGWLKEFGATGIGVAHDYVRDHDPIRIETKGEQYEITRADAVEVIKKYKAKMFKGQTLLGIIPLQAFKKIGTQQMI